MSSFNKSAFALAVSDCVFFNRLMISFVIFQIHNSRISALSKTKSSPSRVESEASDGKESILMVLTGYSSLPAYRLDRKIFYFQ